MVDLTGCPEDEPFTINTRTTFGGEYPHQQEWLGLKIDSAFEQGVVLAVVGSDSRPLNNEWTLWTTPLGEEKYSTQFDLPGSSLVCVPNALLCASTRPKKASSMKSI